jgi:ankyrin repeat protein
LHIAIARGHKDIVELLLEHSADPNVRDADWQTPLHTSSHRGDAEIAEMLIDHGARMNARDWYQLTPLDAARGNSGMEKLLFSHGAHKEASDPRSSRPQEWWDSDVYLSDSDVGTLLGDFSQTCQFSPEGGTD